MRHHHSTAQNHTNGNTNGRIRVLVVDDHPAVRSALAASINGKMDMSMVGEASSYDEAFRIAEKDRPDVAVVDLSLDDAHGFDLVENLRARFPDTRVVVFSMYDESIYAERALRTGASAYIMKSAPTQTVMEAIRQAHRDEVYLSQRMASNILGKVANGSSAGPSFAIDDLTDRELTVFQMLGEGYSIEEISERLNLARKTIETYRRRAKEKLDLDSVAELLQYAVQWTHGQVAS